jgi:AraC family transcriptional regulator of adaptative response/methylated-DNA-[protein]-cysteine methyltransferase
MRTHDYARVEKAIRYLEANFRGQPGLAEVARNAGLSEYHFHRLFTRWAGISPKRFLQFVTASFAQQRLRESAGTLAASLESGLSGPGRLHDLIVNVCAFTPGELGDAGAGVTIRYGVHDGPFGPFFLAVTGRGICALSFLAGRNDEQELKDLRTRWRNATTVADREATKTVAARIFGTSRRGGSQALNVIVRGTNFQLKVWEALVRIPSGFVVSYEGLADRAGAPRAVRAVGSALAANPVAYLIPCHRVIRKSGAFGNYGGGTARKKAMLAWEAARRERE